MPILLTLFNLFHSLNSFFIIYLILTGAIEFIRVKSTIGPDSSLVGTSKQGIASTAVGQGHGIEKRTRIVFSGQSNTIRW